MGIQLVMLLNHTIDIPGRKLLHGEAIAVGMICSLFVYTPWFIKEELVQIQEYILSVYGKVELKELI